MCLSNYLLELINFLLIFYTWKYCINQSKVVIFNDVLCTYCLLSVRLLLIGRRILRTLCTVDWRHSVLYSCRKRNTRKINIRTSVNHFPSVFLRFWSVTPQRKKTNFSKFLFHLDDKESTLMNNLYFQIIILRLISCKLIKYYITITPWETCQFYIQIWIILWIWRVHQ